MSTAHITEFINAVNTEFLKGKKLDELTALWKRISTVPKCPALVKAGTREGQACGKSCVKGQDFCLCHIPREPREPVAPVAPRAACTIVLKTGKRKGESCNKPCAEGNTCVSHSRTTVPAIEPSVPVVSAPAPVSTVTPVVSTVAPVASSSSSTCNFVLTKGTRKGEPCGASCVEHTMKCKKHALLEPVRATAPTEAVSTVVPLEEQKGQKETEPVATVAAATIPVLSIIIPVSEPAVRTNEPKSPDYPPPPHILERNKRLIAAQQEKIAQEQKNAQVKKAGK